VTTDDDVLARVQHDNRGRGTVLSLHDNLAAALEATPKDKDGCCDHRTRYWRVPNTVNVGDTVVISGGA